MPDAGTLNGKYRVGEKIMRGGMGDVYEGTRLYPLGQDRPCAIKFIREDVARDSERVEMFTREALTAMEVSCEHGNLVSVRDFDTTEDGRLFLVMDYVDGPSLYDLASDLRGKYELIRGIAEAMVLALQALQERGITHRDVAPYNILASRDGLIKLIDFSLAKHDDSPHTGRGYGRPAYTAPEVLHGLRATPAADRYALGAVLYELVAGKVPLRRFGGEDDSALPLPTDLPSDLEQLITGLMHPGPEVRLSATKALALLRDGEQPIASTADLAAFVSQRLANGEGNQGADVDGAGRTGDERLVARGEREGTGESEARESLSSTHVTLRALARNHIDQAEQQVAARASEEAISAPPDDPVLEVVDELEPGVARSRHDPDPCKPDSATVSPWPPWLPWLLAAAVLIIIVLEATSVWRSPPDQPSVAGEVEPRTAVAPASTPPAPDQASSPVQPAPAERTADSPTAATPGQPVATARQVPRDASRVRPPRPGHHRAAERWQAFHGVQRVTVGARLEGTETEAHR